DTHVLLLVNVAPLARQLTSRTVRFEIVSKQHLGIGSDVRVLHIFRCDPMIAGRKWGWGLSVRRHAGKTSNEERKKCDDPCGFQCRALLHQDVDAAVA